MAMHSDHDLKIISPKGLLSKRQEGNLGSPRQQKSPHHHNSNGKEHLSPSNRKPRESNGSAATSFSTNHNSVICLPLVSEGLKLVWTQSDQTRELDSIPELVQAFNVFPYPTSQEVSTLARMCALPLDKVKVWFMVQRIKYGISWASEDIEETRLKLARLQHNNETEHKESRAKRKNGFDDLKETDETPDDHIEDLTHSPQMPQKRHKNESPQPTKLSPAASRFCSSLPAPQDSYYYRQPVEISKTPQAATPPTSAVSSVASEQPRHGRYKKSKAQLAALRKSFLRENWPDESELQRLQEETGLTRNDIRKWFSDSRYQLRNGRGSLGLTSLHATQGANETTSSPLSQEVQPLSLTTKKVKATQHAKASEGKEKANLKGARKNRSRESQFFQLFLSNTLEAFEEGAPRLDEKKSLEEGDIQNIDEVRSEVDSERQCMTPPEPAVPTPSPSVTPSKKLSVRPQTLKSACSVKANTSTNSPQPSDQSSPLVLTAAGRPRKTKEQLAMLKDFFQRCPWPKSEEYTQIVELTSLPRADVIQWFGDTRYAVKNGHVRWVHANIRDQVLAEIALTQSGGTAVDSSGTSGSDGSRKRKSQGNSTPKMQKSATDSTDFSPLELYYQQTGPLQEKDLDTLCRKSKMSYQPVRDWFASKDSNTLDTELNVID